MWYTEVGMGMGVIIDGVAVKVMDKVIKYVIIKLIMQVYYSSDMVNKRFNNK